MKKFKKFLRSNAHVVITVPALLCFVTFITNLISALRDGNIDSVELHQLLATVDGFQTVVLCLIALALRDKKK